MIWQLQEDKTGEEETCDAKSGWGMYFTSRYFGAKVKDTADGVMGRIGGTRK